MCVRCAQYITLTMPTCQPGRHDCLTSLHAVAHVRSEDTGDWWRYDDSEVTRMDKGPAGEHGDHGIAAEKKVRLLVLLWFRCVSKHDWRLCR